MLMRWIRKLFCCARECQWETFREEKVYRSLHHRQAGLFVGIEYHMRCKTCGEIKMKYLG